MPITAANIQTQDYKFNLQVGANIWRWTTRMDVSGPSPTFQVRDVLTPYGLLRDTIAIPGDVILAMADSIDQLKVNFPPHILLGPPSSLSFTVNEGEGFTLPQAVVLTNDGVYGSLLGTSLVGSAPYVHVSPANVGNLAANETGSFGVSVDSTTLVAVDSPYAEHVTIQDPNASNTPQTYAVTIIVRPKATIGISPLTLNFTVVRPLSGPFPDISSQQFTLTNTGPSGSLLTYQVQKLTNLSNDWLEDFSPVEGFLTSGGSQLVTVAPAPIEGLGVGTYTETLRVSGYSTNSFVDVLVQLTIT